MLVELSMVEQRYRAVMDVLEQHVPVIEVAARYGVTRQSVYNWVRRYLDGGIQALGDRSSQTRRQRVLCTRVTRFIAGVLGRSGSFERGGERLVEWRGVVAEEGRVGRVVDDEVLVELVEHLDDLADGRHEPAQ